MPYVPTHSTRYRQAAGRHGIRPVAALAIGQDWGEQALHRTWRSLSLLMIALGIANAFVARGPAIVFLALGLWAHVKAQPDARAKLEANPLIGGMVRWWLNRRAGNKH
jgi:hypothetical protein